MVFLRSPFLLAVAAMAAAPLMTQAQQAHWSVPLRNQLTRVNSIDWRLATLAVSKCDARASGLGMALDSLAAYPKDERAAVAAALAMPEGIVVAAVASGSPAEVAGILPGDRLLAVGDTPFVEQDEIAADKAALQLAALPAGKPASLRVERAGEMSEKVVMPVGRCAARSILVVQNYVDAYSDRHNLALTTGLVNFVENDDELALVAGHELAHIILDRDLEAQGIHNKRKEDAADKLGAELASCAGYDIVRGSLLWNRFDKARFLGFLPTFTHRKSKVRQKAIEALGGKVDCSPYAVAASSSQP